MAKRDHIRNFPSSPISTMANHPGRSADRDDRDPVQTGNGRPDPDSMSLERERGITIKDQAVQLDYKAKDGNDYILNLIDTPGHVDFTTKYLGLWRPVKGPCWSSMPPRASRPRLPGQCVSGHGSRPGDHPVINKIDLPSADVPRVEKEIEDILGIPKEDCVLCSAKTGLGVDQVLEAVVKRVPPPKGSGPAPAGADLRLQVRFLQRGCCCTCGW